MLGLHVDGQRDLWRDELMYVADMTLEEALETLQDLEHELSLKRSGARTVPQQLLWDIEDLEGRIEDLT